MGHRCSLVIVENGRSTVYYDHWAANRLDEELFWGPALARAFTEERPPSPDSWLDEIWSDGGAVMDCDAKVLLWHGGEDIRFDAGLNLAHAALMAKQWPEWRIVWAKEGIFDMARALGLPLAQVSSGRAFEPARLTTDQVRGEFYYADAIASFSRGSQKQYGILCGLPEGLAHRDTDSAFIERLTGTFDAAEFARRKAHDPDWGDCLRWGVHVDVDAKTLDVWFADDAPGLAAHLASRWPNWRVTLHGPEFRWHKRFVPEDLLPQTGLAKEREVLALLRRLIELRRTNPADSVVDALRREGEKDIRINPATAAHRHGDVANKAAKRAILDTLEAGLDGAGA